MSPDDPRVIAFVQNYLNTHGGTFIHQIQTEAQRLGLDPNVVGEAAQKMVDSGAVKTTTPPEVVSINGYTIHLHKAYQDGDITSTLASGKMYEFFDTLSLRSFVRRGDFFIDIGANIGWYILMLSECLGPEGLTWAFEPEPTNFAILQRNIKENNLRNVSALQYALGDTIGPADFYLPVGEQPSKGDIRNWKPETGVWESFTAPVHMLDEFFNFPNPRTPDIIKIDTQGSELKVLKGAEKTIARCKNLVLLIELWPPGLKANGADIDTFHHTLVRMGFRTVYALGANNALTNVTGALGNHLHQKMGEDFTLNLIAIKQECRR